MKRYLLFLSVFIFPLMFIHGETGENPGIVYPAKTIDFEPSFSPAFFLPAGKGMQYGGGVQAEFSIADIFERVNLGLSGGYGFMTEKDVPPLLYSNTGIIGSYSFTLFDLIGINPGGGAFILYPHNFNDESIIPAVSGDIEMELHLHGGNFLSFSTAVIYPFDNELPVWFSAGLGIKHSSSMKIEMEPVEVEFQVGPDRFSPDDDGENDNLQIDMWVRGGQNISRWDISITDEYDEVVRSWSGEASPPLRTSWDGYTIDNELVGSAMYYRVDMEIEDILGNVFTGSDEILTDILVRKTDGKYKIMIPNIIFPPNSADFTLLPDIQEAKNREIIKKIAVKLEKYPNYNVRIEGHGNLESWQNEDMAKKEQREILVPLTEARAAIIRDLLLESGINPERLSIEGVGASEPIVPFGDTENIWKNRRVEFVLIK